MMKLATLGRTGITVNKNGFGALPVQRITMDKATALLRRARESGIDFYDTARGYTDSEEKLGEAFGGRRDGIVLATKTMARDASALWSDLETSLRCLRTDYIDIYQLHNISFVPEPGGADGIYDALLKAKQQGKIRFIGVTNHRLAVAEQAVKSELFDTLQFPLSYLSDEKDLALVELCREHNVGFIAMKALSGGLITDSRAACAFMNGLPDVLPIWGIQRESELDEFISHTKNPPEMTDEIQELIRRDKEGISGEFCRGCGYCLPCPADIEIFMCARMSLLIRRSPSESLMSEQWRAKMKKVENCQRCGLCASRCPYGLNPAAMLERNYADYQEILAGKPF